VSDSLTPGNPVPWPNRAEGELERLAAICDSHAKRINELIERISVLERDIYPQQPEALIRIVNPLEVQYDI
jgi:hypothetical protein